MVRKPSCCGLLLAGLVTAFPVAAKSPRDQMFATQGSCYARSYSRAHLADHPAQRVTDIALTPDPGSMTGPLLRLWLKVRVRGSDEVLAALSYCETTGTGGLSCGLEGDAGSFVLTPARNGAVLITVSSLGVGLEGAQGFVTLEKDRGDDRNFLLPPAERCK